MEYFTNSKKSNADEKTGIEKFFSFSRLLLLVVSTFCVFKNNFAQSGLCGNNVPFFAVNLVGNPNGTWVSNPPVARQGNCCGTQAPDRCIEFEVTLDPTAVAINFQIASGAVPPGALFYQVGCGPQIPVGSPICVSGPGPHTITFCKPGNNQNTYSITSIAGPAVSPPDTIGDGCMTKAWVTGLVDSTITWSEITSGTNAYLSYLSCTQGCDTVTVTPQAGYPPYVDYVVCGKSVAICFPFPIWCDTIRVNFMNPIQNSILPQPAWYCANTNGVTLTANILGGLAPYVVNWKNSAGIIVGTGPNYFASSPGNYSMTVYDATYPKCPSKTTATNVTIHPVPTVNAGPDKIICANTTVQVSGSVTNATGGTWTSSGTGTFSPSANALNAVYAPSPLDISNGTVTLTLSTTGNGPCASVSDQMTVTIDPLININVPLPIVCFGKSGNLNANVTGGTAPYFYSWSTGASTQSITNVYPGTYTVTVTDAYLTGCVSTKTVTVTENPKINITAPFNSLVSCDTLVSISVNANGGTGSLGYLWNTGSNSTTINVPTGQYIVVVTDANGCTARDTVDINAANSPLAAFVTQPNNLCAGATTTLQASASGGFGSYSYSWNTGATTSSITVGAGIYCATVTDGQGCMNQYCLTVTQSSPLTASVPTPSTICYGASTSITANASGGKPPYTFSWNTGNSGATLNAVAGTYTVTVSDSNIPACTTTATVTVNQASPLVVTGSSTMVNCNGGNTGSATAIVSGSVGPYNFYWPSNSSTQSSAFGLSAGTYTVNVTDAIGCAQSIAVTVGQPPVLNANISGTTNASCFGSSNGSSTVLASGGTPTYSYYWSPSGGTGSTGSGFTTGTYTVTVTDSKGCYTTATATITQPTQLTGAVTGITPVSCYGGMNGSATVAASGGNGSYSYYWMETGGSTAIENGLGAGTYNVNITDWAGCGITTQVVITSPPELIVTVNNVSSATCYGSANGSAFITASGGTPNYTYYWPSQNFYGSSVSNLPAGTYSYNVSDANNCVVTNTIAVTQPTPLTISTASVTNVICNATCNGAASVSATGGTAPYTYQWNSGQSVPSINGLCAGTYSVNITDSKGCVNDTALTVTQPPAILLNSSVVDAHCDHPDGTATVSVSGGTPAYYYSWNTSPAQYSATANSLVPGNYIVTVTDSKGCLKTATVTVNNTPGVSITAQNFNNTTCSNNCNGSATVTGSGGTGPYTYFWNTSPTQSTATAVNLCPGSYQVIISDYHNCKDTAAFIISAPIPVTASVTATSNAICFGDATTLSASATGGTGIFSYSWNNGAYVGQYYTVTPTSNTTYTVTAYDANGCASAPQIMNVNVSPVPIVNAGADVTVCATSPVIQLTGTITNATGGIWTGGNGTFTPSNTSLNASYNPTAAEIANGQITLTLTSTGNGACAAVSDNKLITIAQQFTVTISNGMVCYGQVGSLSASVSGGVPPYSYTWSNGATTQAISNVPPGTYFVTVTDAVANGCTVSQSGNLYQNPQLFVNLPAYATSCNTTALITANGNGGTGALTYVWSTGATAQSVSVPSGTYSVTVYDGVGCSVQDNIIVNAVIAPISAFSSVPSNLCYNATTQLTASASGGYGSYNYLWSTGSTSTSITVGAGTYLLTATDSAGCNDTTQVVVTQSAQMSVTITNAAAVCNGSSATVSANASGGQGPYTFSWSTGQTTSSITQPAGTYSVTVTDANTPSCSATASVTINQATPLALSGNSTPVSCFGGNNGTATVNATGSVGPYSYAWTSLPDTVSTAINLYAGNFQVTVTDAIGCDQTISIAVTQPTIISSTVTSFTNVACYGGNNGSATVSVTGGMGGYSYSWAPAGGNGSTGTGMSAGNYTVTITDQNLCSHNAYVTLTQPTLLTIPSSSVSHVSCYGGSNGSASVTASGGSGGYSYNWNSGAFTTSSISNLVSGSYSVVVTDISGCTVTTTITVNEPDALICNVAGINNVTCNSGSNGSAALSALGGTPGYSYYWPTLNVSGPSVAGLSAGAYNCSITDSSGCVTTTTVTITQPADIVFNVAVGFDASCNGACDGMAIVVPGGGQIPFSYQWSNGQTAPNLNGLCAGTYSVIATDNNGCMEDTVIIVGEPQPVTVNTSSLPANCFHADGSATANASGGNSGYTFTWNTSPVQYGATATALVPGNYIVTASDNNGCTGSDTIVVGNAPGVVASITNSTNTSCNNMCNGTATVGGTGGIGPYSYSWNTNPAQTNATATTLCPGLYSVTVTDANNCISTASVTISTPPALTLTPLPTSTVICNGQNAVLTASASGGTGNITYSWNNGAYFGATYIVNPNTTTTYTVVAIDSNYCTSSPQLITVTINPALTAIVAPGLNICQGSTTILNANASGGNGNYIYTWGPDSLTGSSITVVPPSTMTYSVVISDGCSSDTAFIPVTVYPLPAVNFATDVNTGCAPLCVEFVNNSTSSTGSVIVGWKWKFGDTDSTNQMNPTYCFQTSGTFDVSLTAVTNMGCTNTFSFSDYIQVQPSPKAEFTLTPEVASPTQPDIYFYENASGETSWLWDFGDGIDTVSEANPVHTYQSDGEFCVTLTVKNAYNCQDTATHCLRVNPVFTFYIPNAFTPNGNGKNETFTGKGENIVEYTMWIYDRWGNMIFETHDLNIPWDGRANGGKEIAQQDVYVYLVKITDIFGEKHDYRGHVTIVK